MPKVEIRSESCKACEYCVVTCPKKVLAIGAAHNSKGYHLSVSYTHLDVYKRPVRYLFNVLELMVPLIFTGVAISVVFAAKQFNLAAEGIFFFGGMVAAVAAIALKLPKGLHAAVCVLLAALLGGVLGALPGLLKYKWNASELVISLMLNYVCFSLSMYVIKNYFRDKNAGAVVSYLSLIHISPFPSRKNG